jgi:hypothetical protein
MKAKLEKQLVALPTDKEKFVNTLEAGVGGKYGCGSVYFNLFVKAVRQIAIRPRFVCTTQKALTNFLTVRVGICLLLFAPSKAIRLYLFSF